MLENTFSRASNQRWVLLLLLLTSPIHFVAEISTLDKSCDYACYQTSLRLHTRLVCLVYSSLWFQLLVSFPQSNVYFFFLQQAYSLSLQVWISLYNTSQDCVSMCLFPNSVLKAMSEVDHYSNCFAHCLFPSGWSTRAGEMKINLIFFSSFGQMST